MRPKALMAIAVANAIAVSDSVQPADHRRRYYDPGANPQPQRPVSGREPVKIAKVTRQLRRQAKNDPELARFIAAYDREIARQTP